MGGDIKHEHLVSNMIRGGAILMLARAVREEIKLNVFSSKFIFISRVEQMKNQEL